MQLNVMTIVWLLLPALGHVAELSLADPLALWVMFDPPVNPLQLDATCTLQLWKGGSIPFTL